MTAYGERRNFKSPEFGEVRTLMMNNEPWFVGKDVAEALGYAKPENALAAHVDGEDKTTTLIQGTGSNYKTNATVINESGLYSLVLSSKLPTAKQFKRWVTHEVIPSIRKHGMYANLHLQAAKGVGKLLGFTGVCLGNLGVHVAYVVSDGLCERSGSRIFIASPDELLLMVGKSNAYPG